MGDEQQQGEGVKNTLEKEVADLREVVKDLLHILQMAGGQLQSVPDDDPLGALKIIKRAGGQLQSVGKNHKLD